MAVIGWIVFGLIVGALAKLVMPGRDPGGIIVTMLLGIAGALLGGFIGRATGLYGPGEAAGFLMSFIGAVILLALYRMMIRRRALRPCTHFVGRPAVAALRLAHVGAPAKTAGLAGVVLDRADTQRGADAVRFAPGALLGTKKRLLDRSGRVRFRIQHLTNGTHEIVGVHRMCEPRVAPN